MQRARARLRGSVAAPAVASVAALALACAGLWWLTRWGGVSQSGDAEIVVYCAAGVRSAVEPILERYESENPVRTRLQVGPSGGLEAQLRLTGAGDLFIPAATDPFLLRLQSEGRVREVIPLAEMRLVLACPEGADPEVRSLRELIDAGEPFGVCNVQAAAGLRTRQTLERVGLWSEVSEKATASLLTVTELAEAVRDGGRLRAGIVWNTTAKQFRLRALETPELKGSAASVGVGLLASCRDPTAARRLARYFASTDGGRAILAEQGYRVISDGAAPP